MRLIDASKALQMIEHSREDNPFFNGKTAPIWEAAHDSAASCVVTCPTIDAVPVKHGRWVWNEENECWVCSNCELSALNDYRGNSTDSNYCPNCGAKMDLEEIDGG